MEANRGKDGRGKLRSMGRSVRGRTSISPSVGHSVSQSDRQRSYSPVAEDVLSETSSDIWSCRRSSLAFILSARTLRAAHCCYWCYCSDHCCRRSCSCRRSYSYFYPM